MWSLMIINKQNSYKNQTSNINEENIFLVFIAGRFHFLEMIWRRAVSYTHLDVYKRQVYEEHFTNCSPPSKSRIWCCFNSSFSSCGASPLLCGMKAISKPALGNNCKNCDAQLSYLICILTLLRCCPNNCAANLWFFGKILYRYIEWRCNFEKELVYQRKCAWKFYSWNFFFGHCFEAGENTARQERVLTKCEVWW